MRCKVLTTNRREVLDRRAAQAMLERGGNALAMEDFERTPGDMVRSGGKLSARLAAAEGVVGFV